MSDFDGVFIAVPTPFRGEDVASDQLAANLRRWNIEDIKDLLATAGLL